MDYRLNEKFLNLYLNAPENKIMNKVLRKVVKEILENYNTLSPSDLAWLESFLACVVRVKRIVDIPKQLNVLVYNHELPEIKEDFVALRDSAPSRYFDDLRKFQAVLDNELNLIITDRSDENQTARDVITGFRTSKYSSKRK